MKIASDEVASEDSLQRALQVIGRDDAEGVAALDALIEDHPRDARLHFLRGSILAGMRLYTEGRLALQQAIALAPDYEIARYQLGFLDYTSGAVASASAIWEPIRRNAKSPYLPVFVAGLTELAADRFEAARAMLLRGMSLNKDNAPLNGDIQRIIDELDRRVAPEEAAEPASSTQMLLDQSRFSTRH